MKVSLDEATHLVHTVDITDTGAQLGGIREKLQPGAIIALQRGRLKANFRIVWIRELAPNELRAGVECMEPQSKFWGVDLSDRQRERGCNRFTSALMTLITTRSR